ncbi:effector-associated domain EAD1-containing protein [Myxococcus sp. AB036A]|uniref:effector-associated domain EAD1-containing protein n=1 Tax=Myxococcus sp. AB036A TaxID=2562793 RepID=UPI0011476364|nr:effector-associated domain EAD1-containing protein [Myxococcus sp. AB036A]
MLPDILLICALKDEYDQVRAITDGLLDPGWVESTGPNGWIVADGSFATSTGPALSIRTTWAGHMGRERAQAVASMLIQAQPARCIAMSGICAGRRGKVALGDVIFANQMWSYDAGKLIVETGVQRFHGETFPYRSHPTWIQRMQRVSIPATASWLSQRPLLPLEHQEDWALLRILAGEDPRQSASFDAVCPDWSVILQRLWNRQWVDKSLTLTNTGRAYAAELALLYPRGLPPPRAFQVHVAPIATGASVTEDEGIFPRLANSMRTVLGVEMEASALGALGEFFEVPVVVAKAVSDYGDTFKDDRYRHFAARASAECLLSLLRNSVDLLHGRGAVPSTPSKESPVAPNAPAPWTNRPGIELPRDLLLVLAEEYPDVKDARALWGRAGGKASEVENISRPQDLWQRLWTRSTQGASVRPEALLRAALEDLPSNTVLLHYVKTLE